MKTIIKNMYVEECCFGFYQQQQEFLNKIHVSKCLALESTFGDLYYCYVFHHSIMQTKEFVVFFSSDIPREKINVFFWSNQDIIAISLDFSVFFIDTKQCQVIRECVITSPFIGFYQISDEKILFLEEACIRIINNNGDVIQENTTDLIEDFDIKDGVLCVKTDKNTYIYNL